MSNNRILIVDDEEDQRDIWRFNLESFGYEVMTAESGEQALQMLSKDIPDLLLLDLKMPGMSGMEVCNRIRKNSRYANLPIIMLTSSDDIHDKLGSFQSGIDDYIVKDMDEQEVAVRIAAVLKRYQQSLDTNPLTHLPGNNAIQNHIQERLDAGKPLAVAYCDMDHFKAFNDAYSFVEGDRVIQFTARVLQKNLEKLGNSDDFLGHIGGDDFIFITTPERVQTLCEAILDEFEAGIGQFYSEEDRRRNFFTAVDRQGRRKSFPLISISIAVVTNTQRELQGIAEVARIASELKKLAKKKHGSVYVVDHRKG